MTAKTPIYNLEYIVQGEPIRNARAALENNAKSIETALAARGVPPTDLQALIAAGWFTDSGWVSIPLLTGFAGDAADLPRVRRRANVLYFRGSILGTGMTASASFAVGTLPVGMRPESFGGSQLAGSTGSNSASGYLNTGGTVTIRTQASVSGYYRMEAFSGVMAQ